jgi:hypothetical protein
MTDESHYYHTLLEFNDLLRKGDIRAILNDLKALDLTTYEQLVVLCSQQAGQEKKVAAIFKP